MPAMSGARTMVIALGVALAGCGPASPTQSPAASTKPSASLHPPLESGFAPCALLDKSSVVEVLEEGLGLADEHLSGVPVAGFRDCVFFRHNHGVVTLAVKQSPTSRAEADALVESLTEEYPPGTQVTTGRLGSVLSSVPAIEFAHCDGACYSSLAFFVEPYFVILTIERASGDFRDAEVLAQRVIDRLNGG